MYPFRIAPRGGFLAGIGAIFWANKILLNYLPGSRQLPKRDNADHEHGARHGVDVLQRERRGRDLSEIGDDEPAARVHGKYVR